MKLTKFFSPVIKDERGTALALTIMCMTVVGTVVGSVMMVTQLSADAQGRGVDQLTAANHIAAASADVLENLSQSAANGNAVALANNEPNCGLSSQESEVKITCQVDNSQDTATATARITLTDSSGHSEQKVITISKPASGDGADQLSESNN
jgi:hypothetical protein